MALIESQPKFAIVKFSGTNCDAETKYGLEIAGAKADIIPIRELEAGRAQLVDYQGTILAGGFSYGDDLGSGKIAAVQLDTQLGNDIQKFIEKGGISLGICNGNQIAAQSNMLLGDADPILREFTMDFNENGKFKSGRVNLAFESDNSCAWLQDMDDYGPIEFQVAHREGRYRFVSQEVLDKLEEERRVLFRYIDNNNQPTELYPENPNGSPNGIAGIVDKSGKHVAMMPHPERSILLEQYNNWRRMSKDFMPEGRIIFEKMVDYARQGV